MMTIEQMKAEAERISQHIEATATQPAMNLRRTAYIHILNAFAKIRWDAIEAAAAEIENFDGWAWCECPECRVDAKSHAVNGSASMDVLASSVRALNDALEPEASEQKGFE